MNSRVGNWASLIPRTVKHPLPSATGQRPYPLGGIPRLRLWEFGQLNPWLTPLLPSKERVKHLERTLYLKDVDHSHLVYSRYYPLYINPWQAVELINDELCARPEITRVSLNPLGWTFYMSKFGKTGITFYAYRRPDQTVPTAGLLWNRRVRRQSRGPLITFWKESGGLVKSVGSREWAYEKPICMVKLQDLRWGLDFRWGANGELELVLSEHFR